MRFSCIIADQGSVENVSRYFRTFAAICRHKIGMKISDDAIELHSAETVKAGGYSLSLKFATNHAFSNYAFLPFSEDLPFILLEIEIKKIADIFNAARGHVRWKLFNKPTELGLKKPHFLLQMRESHCSHHIPVTVITEKRWEAYERQPQPIGKQIAMPSPRIIYKTLQQFKASAARFVILQCDANGKFSLGARMDQAKTVVHFPDCMVDMSTMQEIVPFQSKVAIKSLITCFTGILMVPHCSCVLNVISEKIAEIQVSLYESELSFVVGSIVND